jgi:tetratricopeptide (TPR) repeat protein
MSLSLSLGRGEVRRVTAFASTLFAVPRFLRCGGLPVLMATAAFGNPGAGTEMDKIQLREAERLIERRQPAEALLVLEKLLQEQPDLPGVRYQAALAAQLAGDSAKASKLATEALDRGEDSSELQILLGVMAMKEKKHAEARSAFEKASELDPSNAIALYNLSEAWREDGRTKDAIDALDRALKRAPKDKVFLLKRRLAQMETDEGFEEVESEVIKRQNDERQTEDWLMTAAAVHLKKGNYRQATQSLRSAQGVAGSDKVRAIFSEDHFFRLFAKEEGLTEIRQELGLE